MATAGADDGFVLVWTYNRYRNRWSQTASGSGNATAVQPSLTFSDNNNHIDGFSYDAAGNLLNDGRNSYTYDAEGRLVTLNGNPTYAYDAEGYRVAKLGSGGSVLTSYLLSLGGEQVTELNVAGQWVHSNVFVGGRLLATYEEPHGITAAGYHFHLTDWLGTKRVQTTAAGNQEEVCYSYSFGDGLNCTGTDATEHHFTSKERDIESGLDYFFARYYTSTLGRFMSPDWAAKAMPVPWAKLDNPQSLDLYAYVANNPLSRADGDGHSFLIFDGASKTITLYDKNGNEIGHWDAGNNVQSSATIGKLVDNNYQFSDTTSPHTHSDDGPNSAFGSDGIFRLKDFVGADGKTHTGVGVHSGREDSRDKAGHSGTDYATNGCVRTTDDAMDAISGQAATDPLTALAVMNNRTNDNPDAPVNDPNWGGSITVTSIPGPPIETESIPVNAQIEEQP